MSNIFITQILHAFITCDHTLLNSDLLLEKHTIPRRVSIYIKISFSDRRPEHYLWRKNAACAAVTRSEGEMNLQIKVGVHKFRRPQRRKMRADGSLLSRHINAASCTDKNNNKQREHYRSTAQGMIIYRRKSLEKSAAVSGRSVSSRRPRFFDYYFPARSETIKIMIIATRFGVVSSA
jgi:hypothetical protein